MSFLRHRRSFRPMWQEQTGSRLGSYSRLSSARMSRCRLFLGGAVSTGARFASSAAVRMLYSGPAGRAICSERQTVSYSVVSAEGSTPRRFVNSRRRALQKGLHTKHGPESYWPRREVGRRLIIVLQTRRLHSLRQAGLRHIAGTQSCLHHPANIKILPTLH